MLLDMLNRPIKVGDTVLVKAYYSTNYTRTTVTKVCRVNIQVVFPNIRTYTKKEDKWQWISIDKTMSRDPLQVIVINEQLEYNQSQWPELSL